MPQHDYNIANNTFPAVRADINAVLQAILSLNSGTSPPATTLPGTLWLDTSSSPPVLKIRNEANNNWIALFELKNNLALMDASGAVMTGPLQLHGNPTASLHAATKIYVDARVQRTGDEMQGPLGLVVGTIMRRAGGIEGGELWLEKPDSGTSINGGHVVFDVRGNQVRIFESGSPYRGVYFDITHAKHNAGSNLVVSDVERSTKAWCRWSGGASPTFAAGQNISSITRQSQGTFQVNFTDALSGSNYCVVVTTTGTTQPVYATVDQLTSSGFRVRFFETSTPFNLVDPDGASVVVHGGS